MQTRENFTTDKSIQIEQQILIYLSEYHEKYNLIDENTDTDVEFEVGYYMIEKDLLTVNIDFYCAEDNSAEGYIWLYKKQIKINTTELIERIEILTSYE